MDARCEDVLPLFAEAGPAAGRTEPDADLPPMPPGEAVIHEDLDFTVGALAAGATGALVDDATAADTAAGAAIVQVSDTTRALQDLARHVRRQSGARVVAIIRVSHERAETGQRLYDMLGDASGYQLRRDGASA